MKRTATIWITVLCIFMLLSSVTDYLQTRNLSKVVEIQGDQLDRELARLREKT